jgi:hypothetical protein
MIVNTTQFKYCPDTEIVHYCHHTYNGPNKFPARIIFEKWCDDHGLGCTYWNGAPYDVYGVTAELFVLFKMTWG